MTIRRACIIIEQAAFLRLQKQMLQHGCAKNAKQALEPHRNGIFTEITITPTERPIFLRMLLSQVLLALQKHVIENDMYLIIEHI